MGKQAPAMERFLAKILKTNACWNWGASLSDRGYGKFWPEGGRGPWKFAHRFSFAQFKGPLIKGMHIDHLCRNRKCVNPAHLEQVTPKENIMRSPVAPARINRLKTHCNHGHTLSGDNLKIASNGYRTCIACANKHKKNYREKNRELIALRAREKRSAR